jgi:hypothetical protein
MSKLFIYRKLTLKDVFSLDVSSMYFTLRLYIDIYHCFHQALFRMYAYKL